MIGPAEQHRISVAIRFFGEVFVGDRRVFGEPVGGRKRGQRRVEREVDFAPQSPDFCRRRSVDFAVFGEQEQRIEFGMGAFTEAEEAQHAIVDGGEVAHSIDESIFSWRDFRVQRVVAQPSKHGVDRFEV